MRTNFLLSLLVLFTPNISAQNSLLWKVEKKGMEPSYLYGTIHVMPASKFNIPEKVNKAFDASSQVVMELDMSQPGMQLEIMQPAMTTGYNSLSEMLSPTA